MQAAAICKELKPYSEAFEFTEKDIISILKT